MSTYSLVRRLAPRRVPADAQHGRRSRRARGEGGAGRAEQASAAAGAEGSRVEGAQRGYKEAWRDGDADPALLSRVRDSPIVDSGTVGHRGDLDPRALARSSVTVLRPQAAASGTERPEWRHQHACHGPASRAISCSCFGRERVQSLITHSVRSPVADHTHGGTGSSPERCTSLRREPAVLDAARVEREPVCIEDSV